MPNLMRVRTVFEYGAGSPGLMTQYFGNDAGDYNDADAQVAVNRVRDGLATSPTLFPPSFGWTVTGEVDVIDDVSGEVQSQLAADEAVDVGTCGTGVGPLPVGLLLKARSDSFVSGHRLVGRTYLVPVCRTVLDGGSPNSGTMAAVKAIGDAFLTPGLTLIFPYVWSRPRPATAVGPHRPAGPARAARDGSSARVTSYACSPKFVILTSRRD